MSLLAKGVRGPKPRFGGALEIMAASDLVYYVKPNRELQLLSQATLLEPHLSLSSDLTRFAYGTGVCEFMLKLLKAPEPPGRVYPLTLRVFECLAEAPLVALDDVFRAFQIKAVAFLGHKPELRRCVECGGEIRGSAGFSFFAGGAVCRGCLSNTAGTVRLSEGARLKILQWMNSTLADLYHAEGAGGRAEAVNHLEGFLSEHIERYERLKAMRLVPSFSKVGV